MTTSDATNGKTIAESHEPAGADRTVARAVGRIALVLAVAVPIVALVIAIGGVDLLKPEGGSGKLGDFNEKIAKVEAPATVAFASLSGLGLVAGGAMAAVGMPQGIRMMSLSALAGGGVVLGKGLIA